MAASARAYGNMLAKVFGSTSTDKVDWVNDTIMVGLLGAGYTPNVDTHIYWSDVSANEIAAGGGYASGGLALAGKSIVYDSSAHTVRLKAGTSQWLTSTISYRYAAIYKSTGTGSTSLLLGYFDPGGTEQDTGGTLSIVWDATNGIFAFAV